MSVGISRVLPAEYEAPRAARHFIADRLARWGHSGTFIDDARLVVTELANNAVLHARSPFTVWVRAEGSGVRISVRDSSSTEPMLRDNGPAAQSGRGLSVIAAMCADWGVDVDADGKTVWATLQIA